MLGTSQQCYQSSGQNTLAFNMNQSHSILNCMAYNSFSYLQKTLTEFVVICFMLRFMWFCDFFWPFFFLLLDEFRFLGFYDITNFAYGNKLRAIILSIPSISQAPNCYKCNIILFIIIRQLTRDNSCNLMHQVQVSLS